jgi:hypothetical protein
MLTVDDWMKKFIDQLIHIVHGQWIYRNISKHHDTLGSIRKTERRQLLLEIDRLMTLTPEDVPEESKFLLEVDFARLRTGDIMGQHYWVHAVKAAVMAGRRKTFLSRRHRAAPSGCRPSSLEQPPMPYGVADDTTTSIEGTVRKRSRGGSGSTDDKSNKRRRPD